ncbi:MAG: hypothetical protein LBG99_03510 [Propionibacteriaceae bacterium]|nr:hypothetical protein [Propionibacteriaceae bacterium]
MKWVGIPAGRQTPEVGTPVLAGEHTLAGTPQVVEHSLAGTPQAAKCIPVLAGDTPELADIPGLVDSPAPAVGHIPEVVGERTPVAED